MDGKIDVCAAVVLRGDRLLLATRPSGTHLEGKWEFPGGKVGPSESLAQCIERELAEELQLAAHCSGELFSLDYEYPEKRICLHFMACAIDNEPRPAEGQSIGWFNAQEALALDLAPADGLALEKLKRASDGGDEGLAPELAEPILAFMKKLAPTQGQRMPDWLRVAFSGGRERLGMSGLVHGGGLHTVCEGAKCPNRCDCWKRGTATFMIMGDTCTRNCRFCAVNHGKPQAPEPDEAAKLAQSVAELKLKYAVVTCVTRDDLPDGGANAMAEAIKAIRSASPETKVEVLCSDYKGNMDCVDIVLEARPAVYGHNVETVERLTPAIRNMASYRRSLSVLEHASRNQLGIMVKSGIMLGLGETDDEIRQTLADLRTAGVSMVTIGQYLRPTRKHWPISKLYTPAEFQQWQDYAEKELGFAKAVAGPLVRSSYMAEEAYNAGRR